MGREMLQRRCSVRYVNVLIRMNWLVIIYVCGFVCRTAAQLRKNIPNVENVVTKSTADLKQVGEAEAKASEKVTRLVGHL